MGLDFAVGELVNVSYNPTFIVFSYIISIVGCWTALELLQRRTSIHGFYNWLVFLPTLTDVSA